MIYIELNQDNTVKKIQSVPTHGFKFIEVDGYNVETYTAHLTTFAGGDVNVIWRVVVNPETGQPLSVRERTDEELEAAMIKDYEAEGCDERSLAVALWEYLVEGRTAEEVGIAEIQVKRNTVKVKYGKDEKPVDLKLSQVAE